MFTHDNRQIICSSILGTSVQIVIRKQASLSLLRDGGVQTTELKGDMNLQISDATYYAHLHLTLPHLRNSLQFKQHPNVTNFALGRSV
jgi:hypothetical protein